MPSRRPPGTHVASSSTALRCATGPGWATRSYGSAATRHLAW